VRGHGGFVVAPGAKFRGTQYQRRHGSPSTIEAFRNGIIPVLLPSLVELLRAEEPSRTNGADATEHLLRSPTNATRLRRSIAATDAAESAREQSYADTALRNTINELAVLAEGSRNIELNNAALKMGHQIAAGRIGRAKVESGLYNASVANGLVKDSSASAVRATIASGLNAGMKEPSPPLQDRPEAGLRHRPRANGGYSYKTTLKFTTAPAPDTAELLSVCAADVSMKAITWLWPDRFAVGKLGLIVGLPDEGKGQLLSFFCAAITTGGDWPMEEGRAPQGSIILFSDEDDAEDTLAPAIGSRRAPIAAGFT